MGPGPGPGEASDEPPGGPRPGDEVAGVRLTALVGRGGAGSVWSGTEVGTGARVAVKLLDHTSGQEATLMAGVRHPHVLALRRVHLDPPALVTDLAAGGSLAAQVRARGTLTAGEVVTLVAPLADALGALHARGVVHGDVTGTNVLFVDRGRPVLSDLGVAGLAGDGVAWATPGYAAPEVLAGAAPGPAADVHGLGATAWLALTGSVPAAEGERLPLGLLAPDCPPALASAVTAALHPEPSQRPTPSELATAARAACPGLAVRLVPAAALGVGPDEAVTFRVREAAAADGDPPLRQRRWSRVVRWGARTWPRGARGTAAGWRSASSRGRLGAVCVVVVVSALAATTVLLPRTDAGSTRLDGTAPPPDAHTRVARSSPTVAAGAPGVARSSGDLDLTDTVTGLVQARGEALRAGDAEALLLVHAPEGTTLQADRRAVRSGPVDVSYEVVRVVPVPGDPAAAAVQLRTTASGVTAEEEVVLGLVLGDDGWRVRSVTG